MGAITRIAVGETSVERGRRHFRSATRTKLPPDVHARQSRIALLAFQTFPHREAALLFLNGGDNALGGRPIDVASASEAGAARVAAALRSRSEHAGS